MTTTTSEKIMPDVHAEIIEHYRARGVRQAELAEDYFAHLIEGGDPAKAPMLGYVADPDKRLESNWQRETYRAWEREARREPTPLDPTQGHRVFETARFMHHHLGEWIPWQTLRPMTGGTPMDSMGAFGYSFRKLEGTGYTIEKGRVDGKVQYRMMRVES